MAMHLRALIVVAVLFATSPAIPARGSAPPSWSSPGHPLWLARYDGPASGLGQSNAMARSPDGSEVFVTGKSSSERTDYDAATVAYDANTGATLWVSRFDDPAHTYGEGKAVAVSPDGSEVFITGTMGGNPGTIY